MAARLIPEDPRFTTESEHAVWAGLRDTLGPRDTLIANHRLTDSTKDHEADLIVVLPDAGVVVVEVKGSGLGVRDGHWYMRHDGGERRIDPVAQARDTRYAVRKYIEGDGRWADSSRGKVRTAHAVVTPFTDLGEGFDLPDCPRWLVHDRHDLPDLAGRLRDVALRSETNRRPPSDEDCAVIVDILTGSTRSSSTRRRTSPSRGGARSSRRSATRTTEACSSTPTRTSGSSSASAARRSRLCPWCSTTTCATPSRSRRCSGPSRPCGCGSRAATGPRCCTSPPGPTRERMYVGLSRATDRLIVVGDTDAIRRAGDEVVRALRGGRQPGQPGG